MSPLPCTSRVTPPVAMTSAGEDGSLLIACGSGCTYWSGLPASITVRSAGRHLPFSQLSPCSQPRVTSSKPQGRGNCSQMIPSPNTPCAGGAPVAAATDGCSAGGSMTDIIRACSVDPEEVTLPATTGTRGRSTPSFALSIQAPRTPSSPLAPNLTSASTGDESASPVEAEVRLGASGEEGVLGAWIESAKDGVDLPRVPVVAGSVTSSGSTEQARIMSVMEPPAEQPSVAAVTGAPPTEGVLGEGIIWEQLPRPWGLDEVTRGWLQGESWLNGRCRPAERTVILAGSPGQYVQPLPQAISNDPSSPALVMATGGVTLDVQGRGDIYGVLVSDGGSIALDGTRLHGAAFATRDLRLGTSGSVRWDPQALRYATDRSLVKLRLMPGSRYEYPRG